MKIKLRVKNQVGLPKVTVGKRMFINAFAEKVGAKLDLDVKAFNLKYEGKPLYKTKNNKALHVRDYGLVDGCIVDVIILAKPRTRTDAPKDQKFSLDFQFENDYVINVGKFHLGTSGRVFCQTANRELSANFPELNFEAIYFIGETEITRGSKVKLSKHNVTVETVIRVVLADGCKDQVLAMLNDDFQAAETEAELPKANVATLDELIEAIGPDLFKPRVNVPKEVDIDYGIVIKELVEKAKTASDRLASLIYTGTVSTSLDSLDSVLEDRFETCRDRRQMKSMCKKLGMIVLFRSEQLDEFQLESRGYAVEAVELAIGDMHENAKENGGIFHEKFINCTGNSSACYENGLRKMLPLQVHGERILEVIDERIKQAEYVFE